MNHLPTLTRNAILAILSDDPVCSNCLGWAHDDEEPCSSCNGVGVTHEIAAAHHHDELEA